MGDFDILSDYSILNTACSLSEYLTAGGAILCNDADEWDLALDLAQEAGLRIGFRRTDYRPDGDCAPKGNRSIYYVPRLEEVHSHMSDDGVPIQAVLDRFTRDRKEKFEIDETCVLYS